jgi:hypothetical protein
MSVLPPATGTIVESKGFALAEEESRFSLGSRGLLSANEGRAIDAMKAIAQPTRSVQGNFTGKRQCTPRTCRSQPFAQQDRHAEADGSAPVPQ